MKTAVSIPDDVFKRAERVAKRLKKSRSELYADALAEYLARREPHRVTSEIDAVLDEIDQEGGAPFLKAAGRRTVGAEDW